MNNETGLQKFGGDWTEEKLENINKYLKAYTTIMNKQNLKFAYIDAFAGTGFRELSIQKENLGLDFFSVTEEDNGITNQFLDGSAAMALKVEPPFDSYLFIEKDEARYKALLKLKVENPDKDIVVKNQDANDFVQEICSMNWKKHRAVMFLDPYGMQVSWQSIKAIAETEAIDLWLLFPLGAGVNRMLPKDGNISQAWRDKLNDLFGTDSWYDEFYKTTSQQTLFGEESIISKSATFESIASFFEKRLSTIFPHVAPSLFLYNTKKNPLFMLCFAAGNPKGGKTAVKIAKQITGKK
jgi:three-Cys-motif partner protein